MVTAVKGDADSQTFINVKDFESKRRGDKSGTTFCGPRLYRIIDEPSYIKFDTEKLEITLATSSDADIGQFIVELEMKLEDYPDVTSIVQF